MGEENKAEILLGSLRLIDHVYKNFIKQLDDVIINAPTNLNLGLPNVKDFFEGGLGPLSGIHAGLAWAKEHKPSVKGIITVPVDCPFFPNDLVAKLSGNNQILLAKDTSGLHPVFGYWPLNVLEDLEAFIKTENRKSVQSFAGKRGFLEVNFGKNGSFFNINSKADLKTAKDMLG